jgi:hypothetical protein
MNIIWSDNLKPKELCCSKGFQHDVGSQRNKHDSHARFVNNQSWQKEAYLGTELVPVFHHFSQI